MTADAPADVQPGPARRIGAASVVVGSRLFAFGGLVPSGAESGMARWPMRHSLHHFAGCATQGEVPTSELLVLDLDTHRARRVPQPDRAPWPPPRAFACLAHDAQGDRLVLHGGRRQWSMLNYRRSEGGMDDVWLLDLRTMRWRALPGEHPAIEIPGPCGVHGGALFVIDPGFEGAEFLDEVPVRLWRCELGTGRWSVAPSRGGNAPPRLRSPLAGWIQDAKLFLWAPNKFGPPEKRTPVNTSSLWAVALGGGGGGGGGGGELEWGAWEQYVAIGPEEESDAKRIFRLGGTVHGPTSEATACFEPRTRKAYVFGGWDADRYDHSVDPETGRMIILTGRYFANLVEIDVDGRRIRALEAPLDSAPGQPRCPIAAVRGASGPGPRGYPTVAAYSPADGPARVLVGFGYTTLGASGWKYENVRALGDVWQCELLPAGAAAAGPAAALRAGAASSGLGALGGGAAGTSSSIAVTTQLDLSGIWTRLNAHLVAHAEVRNRAGELHPPGRRGALLGELTRGMNEPVESERFFSAEHLRWYEWDELLAYLPGLERVDAETFHGVRDTDPARSFALVYVGISPEMGARAAAHVPAAALPPGAVHRPYLVFYGSYGRYRPDATYVSRNAAMRGELKTSAASAQEMAQGHSFEVRPGAVLQVCAHSGCPTRFSECFGGGAAAALSPAEQASKLMACTGCYRVRYCSAACQKADWKAHKRACREAQAEHRAAAAQ